MRKTSLDDMEAKIMRAILPMLAFIESASGEAVIFNKDQSLEFDHNPATIGFGMISDTIVIYPLHPNDQDPVELLCRTVALLMAFVLQLGWLLRGAIALGSFRAIPEAPIYLGTAILAAHSLELAQDWSGCVLSHEIADRYPQEVDHLKSSGLVVDYDVPLKSLDTRTPHSTLAVNWFFYKNSWGQKRTN